ncbi:hypothetical protein [Arthrobacter sp. NPDC090010]|uniref:hypothetical protein n=1 Tax=Arthrobacter sp. NPDC090010 TaxID=3363942 RepID=UPI0037FDB066
MSRRKGPLVVCTATVNPIGHRPLKELVQLSYRNAEQMTEQIRLFAKHHGPRAARIQVDTATSTIFMNGMAWAKYHLNPARDDAAEQEALEVES